MGLVLACTEGGRNGGLVWLIILAALATWIAVTVVIFRSTADRKERRLLLGLLMGSIVLGPLIFAPYYTGFFGSRSSTGVLALLLTIPGLIGAVIAHLTGAANRLRAFLISTWGAIFLAGGGIIMFLVAVTVGGACLE
ncbi:MAG: hypothetical protein ACTHNY_00170 [Solirubrobacterales bacterium]